MFKAELDGTVTCGGQVVAEFKSLAGHPEPEEFKRARAKLYCELVGLLLTADEEVAVARLREMRLHASQAIAVAVDDVVWQMLKKLWPEKSDVELRVLQVEGRAMFLAGRGQQ